MSNTAHGITCRCQKCKKLNNLSGEAFKLSVQVVEAKKNGEDERAEELCTQLEQANSEATKLNSELGR